MLKSSSSILPMDASASVNLSLLGSPRFIVTVDTEEEFDWSAPFSSTDYGITHIAAIPRFQSLCEKFGVKPCYLVDYPVTQDDRAAEMLGGVARDGNAEIGVQLHPWVNPPLDETLSRKNSFACNLPEHLERAKLTALHAAIAERMGAKPDAYRAGRYGAGGNTPGILAELDIFIDSSVRSRFDYSAHGGPDYSRHPVNPYWLVPDKVIELPVTTIFGGLLKSAGDLLFAKCFESDPARSLLARTNLLERIALTPEGIPVEKAIQGIDLALEEGVQIINLSFHSPSLAVGHTPYVRDDTQLEQLYDWWVRVFEHLSAKGVAPTTMAEIKSAVTRSDLR